MPTKSQKQMTTAAEQWCMASPSDAQAMLQQQQQWDHLWEFHASIPLWPMDIPMQGTEGGSPLLLMMFYPLSKTTWLLIYAWTGHLDIMPGIDCPTNHATERPPCLSQSRWNSRPDSGWASPPTPAILGYTHWLPVLAKTKTRLLPEITQTFQSSHHPRGNGSICTHFTWATFFGQLRKGLAKPRWKVTCHSSGLCSTLPWLMHGSRPMHGMGIWRITCPRP